MNPNFLLKEELLYELGIRGIHSEADTLGLRKLFRSIGARELPLQFDYFNSRGVEEWYSVVTSKISELQSFVTQTAHNLALATPRARTKLLHLRGRLSHLTAAELCSASSETSLMQRLHDQLDEIEQTLARAENNASPNPEPTIETTTGEMAHRSNGRPDTQDSRPVGVHHAGEVRSSTQGDSPSFISNIYQKLNNPLCYLLKALPVVDGNDAHALCAFLLKVINIRKVGRISQPTIYELLYPYCRGELLNCLNQALEEREPFEHFHARLLHHFIPARQLSILRMEKYERVQEEQESLAMYVQAVREAALVLRITESEAEVVARIVQGLNPVQRARFVFQALPSTFAQLEQLAVVDRNVTYADSTRAKRPVAEKSSETRLTTATVTHSTHRVNKPHASGKPILCFSCGKPGHIQRNCYVRSPNRRNQARCSMTRT